MFTSVLFKIIILITLITLKGINSLRVCKTFNSYYDPFSENCYDNPDAESNTTEILRRWGFTAEEYYLQTEDGYIILINRAYKTVTQKSPIILGHGISMNSLAYCNRGNKSFAHFFANRGYDVWILNFRGTRYSTGHVRLTTNEDAYWQFSFHEMAIYDLRSSIKFITKSTKQKATYIGFSMGTTTAFIYSSIFPNEAKENLNGIIQMAPVAYLKNIPSVVKYIVPFTRILEPLITLMNHGEIRINGAVFEYLFSYFPFQMYVFEILRGSVFGLDLDQMDPHDLPLINFMDSDNVGVKVLIHYSQLILSERFQQFDFGSSKNLKVYGQTQPPKYDLSKIIVPISIFTGKNDYLATPENAEHLYSELVPGTRCGNYLVKYDRWSHNDFIEAKDIIPLLLDKLLKKVVNLNNGIC